MPGRGEEARVAARARVVELLRTGAWLPAREVRNATGLRDSTARILIREMVDQQLLRRRGEGRARVYQIAAA